jgi:competence protein ComEA
MMGLRALDTQFIHFIKRRFNMKKFLLATILFFSFTVGAFAAVNLNTATLDQLETLKGVGPAKAQAIIDYRKKNGNFKTVDELNNVPGFGDKTLAKLKPEITVSGGSAPASASPAKTADKAAMPKK